MATLTLCHFFRLRCGILQGLDDTLKVFGRKRIAVNLYILGGFRARRKTFNSQDHDAVRTANAADRDCTADRRNFVFGCIEVIGYRSGDFFDSNKSLFKQATYCLISIVVDWYVKLNECRRIIFVVGVVV